MAPTSVLSNAGQILVSGDATLVSRANRRKIYSVCKFHALYKKKRKKNNAGYWLKFLVNLRGRQNVKIKIPYRGSLPLNLLP